MSLADDVEIKFVGQTDRLLGAAVWGLSRIHGSMFFIEMGESSSRLVSPRTREPFYKAVGESGFTVEGAFWRFIDDTGLRVVCENDQPHIDEVFSTYSSTKLVRAELNGLHDLLIETDHWRLELMRMQSRLTDYDVWTFRVGDHDHWIMKSDGTLAKEQ